MRGIILVSCMAFLLSCGGRQDGTASSCTSDEQCQQAMSDQCPGGSSTFATCTEGACVLQGCSSPIGTPCDDDPATVFDNEDCPDEGNDEP